MFSGELPPARHRALQLGMLHADTRELVELTPARARPTASCDSTAAAGPSTTCPAAPAATDGWLEALLGHAERIVTGAYARELFDGAPREEAFVGVAPRTQRRGSKDAVARLAVSVGRRRPARPAAGAVGVPGRAAVPSADRVRRLRRRARLLEAHRARCPRRSRCASEPIERANARIIHALGVDADGRPTVADPQCRERARVMRLAGTVNYKTGAYARVVEADLQLPGYRLEELIGDLAGPRAAARQAPRPAGLRRSADPYKRIPPPEYFQRLAGITVPRGGLVSLPGAVA